MTLHLSPTTTHTDADTRIIPKGPFTFVKWEKTDNEGDSITLSAVWKNATGEEHQVSARCISDIMDDAANPQSKIYHPEPGILSKLTPSFPKEELKKCAKAYADKMVGHNRSDLGALGATVEPFMRP